MRERTELEDRLGAVSRFDRDLEDAITLVELAEAEGDAEVEREAVDQLKALKLDAERRQVEALLSGEAGRQRHLYRGSFRGGRHRIPGIGPGCCFVCMPGGPSGGNSRSRSSRRAPAKEAGIKSATILIKGHNAYGWAKTESGVHRLVRISPFDSNARRHTSFASAWVYPVVDDRIDIVVNESDCRIDTYRSSGAGGQHVNTTDSAVRITHVPSGIVVACQGERSQHKNRATAWNMLRARLYELELEKREAKANADAASKTDVGWGHQIRSYVLQPYQLVKDLRTGMTSGTPDEVLDGDLDDFMEASLAQRLSGRIAESKTSIDVTLPSFTGSLGGRGHVRSGRVGGQRRTGIPRARVDAHGLRPWRRVPSYRAC